MLRWDGDGFLLYYKRLEGGTFEFPTFNPYIGHYEVSYTTLTFILIPASELLHVVITIILRT